MPIIFNRKNRTLIVKVSGELDLVSAQEFRESIDRAMEDMLSQNLLVDLSKVSFIDSSGLGVLLGRYRIIKAKNGQMLLFGLNPNLRKILELSGVTSYLPFYETESDCWKIIERKPLKEA